MISDREDHPWNFLDGDMQKEVLFLHLTILGVIEVVENKPALDPLCLDMSEILSETTLIPGLFT